MAGETSGARPTLRTANGDLQVPALHRHAPLEACIGAVWGMDPSAAALPERPATTPRAAFEEALLPCLARPPCVVAFSGGRDSSTVLAVATQLARTHGLALPIPVTNRFPNAEGTDEAQWQEQVVAHLGLKEWERLEWTHELDVLGPYAIQVLRRHGPLMPFNSHFLEPLLDQAAGGSLATGIGGDELIAVSDRPILNNLLFRAQRPRRSQLKALVLEAAPRRIRAQSLARELPINDFRWLRPEVRRQIVEEYARDLAQWPLRWDRMVEKLWRCRHLQCIRSSLDVQGRAHDVRMGNAFLDAGVLAAYARSQGRAGPSDRGSALVDLVGDLLPELVLRRKTKAAFDDPFFNRYSRDFTRAWSGRGVDAGLVDASELLAEWRSPEPTPNSYTLLQQAWLADNA